ncbi:MAG TPA: DEAD/DEAH box helicase [Thermoanaerobaculia bacterium]|nr:DEAD/DEAH box helicase [Thermoanaerobaculia bacterium]
MSAPSTAFHQLHPRIQRWLWQQGWAELRDIQEASIPAILDGESDVVIAAATAGGKTEAAFLPVLTSIAEEPGGSIRVLYVSPLKALINDQYDRLELLCGELEIPVHRWHGDVAASRKRQVLDQPAGVLIITPESLEALFILQGPKIRRLFERLAFVVIDELHAFLGTERGQQLQSLLHRVELAVRRRVPRIALSATLGDLSLAAAFLRPGGGEAVRRIESKEGGQELRVQVRGYRELPPRLTPKQAEQKEEQGQEVTPEDLAPGDTLEISSHLYERLRGGHHLIFANARKDVELYADLLRRLCERDKLANEFWPHHGSLSRDLREEAEAAIKDRSRPASAVCTTTLELGIDVGAIGSVAQIGPPPSVASLRQRLGRSGRQGGPAVLRGYVREPEIDIRTAPHAALRSDLVEFVAAVRLLVAGWCEPPQAGALHLSTLVQQVLSLIVQHGGVQTPQAWRALCRDGPFAAVGPDLFAELLRSLGANELIRQEPTGELILDLKGERITNHYSFYAAFQTPEEYRLMSGGKPLGTLPIAFPLFPGLFLIFGGRRWAVVGVDEEKKIVDLKPAMGGRLPDFMGGRGAPVHDRVRQEMLDVYRSADVPPFLDARARDLLAEGRATFARYGLAETDLLPWAGGTLLFPWKGDQVLDTLVIWLSTLGHGVSREGVALIFSDAGPDRVREECARLAAEPPPDPVELAAAVINKKTEKFHLWLSDGLLTLDLASRALDVAGAWGVVGEVG